MPVSKKSNVKRARSSSAGSKMSFQNRVLGVINKTRESKTSVSRVVIRQLSSSVTFSAGDVLELLPALAQSTSGYNGRVGNEIIVKKLKIRTIVTVDSPLQTSFQGVSSCALIRDMILEQKDSSGSAIAQAINGFDENNLMRNALGPSSYDPDLESYMRPINDEAFTIRKDTRFSVFGAVNSPAWAAPGHLPEGTKFEEYVLDFGISGLRLNYTDATDQYPNNFPYFRILTAISADGTPTGVNNAVGFTGITEMIYHDV